MRKKFDDVKTESSRVENEIDKRQKLLELLKTEETKYLTMLNNCKQVTLG